MVKLATMSKNHVLSSVTAGCQCCSFAEVTEGSGLFSSLLVLNDIPGEMTAFLTPTRFITFWASALLGST